MEQFDTLLAELTVKEMLMYTAELKCPVSVSLFYDIVPHAYFELTLMLLKASQ